jgi:hypothetical protein
MEEEEDDDDVLEGGETPQQLKQKEVFDVLN